MGAVDEFELLHEPDPPGPSIGLPVCWTRGGLTVTTLQREFNDPGWEPRGKFRSLLQFIMNWNNWPSHEDRSAMLDGPPPAGMPEAEKARIAAVVHCLCERDDHPLPNWVHGVKARCYGGVFLTDETSPHNKLGWTDGHSRIVKRRTHPHARKHRVWFEAEMLEKR